MNNHYEFERSYWGDCCNTYDEETKQYVYASLMEIPRDHYTLRAYVNTIVDIGGGPSSMLLKTVGFGTGYVVDPIEYPIWTRYRYDLKRINYLQMRGEDLNKAPYPLKADEVWIYNVLQHTDDPALIIKNAREIAPVIRMFEWIDIPAHDGHPQELTQDFLENALGRTGRVTDLYGTGGCSGRAFYGVFRY